MHQNVYIVYYIKDVNLFPHLETLTDEEVSGMYVYMCSVSKL